MMPRAILRTCNMSWHTETSSCSRRQRNSPKYAYTREGSEDHRPKRRGESDRRIRAVQTILLLTPSSSSTAATCLVILLSLDVE